MSVAEVQSRIDQIQAQLVSLRALAVKTNATTSTAFADALSGTTASAATTTATDAATSADGTVTGDDVVAEARKFLGVPYVFGGTTSKGIDCSGLVQTVYKNLGIQVPRLVSGQSKMGTEVASLADAQPGDLIVCEGGNHIAIWAGNDQLLYAPKPGDHVKLNKNYLKDSDVVTIRRLVPTAAEVAAKKAARTASTPSSTSVAASLAALLSSSGTGASGLSGLSGLSSLGGSGLASGLLGSGATKATGQTDLQTAALLALINGGSLS